MIVLRLFPLALALAACNTVNVPLSPHRIDVQQGNALEQEAVDKLKVGMTRSQVRFLLGTPLLTDPFHSNRWDYVYNYRTAGKLTGKKRLTLFFEGDVLARIDREVLPTGSIATPAEVAEPVVVANAKPSGTSAPQSLNGSVDQSAMVKTLPDNAAQALPEAKPTETTRPDNRTERSLNETSIVSPLRQPESEAQVATKKAVPVTHQLPESIVLRTETNVKQLRPDVIPAFPRPVQSKPSLEEQVLSATNAWAKAWRERDEEAYFAAYAPNFRPQWGVSRAEWEKRRRLLLGLSRHIDLKLDSISTQMLGDKSALVTFNQFYTSGKYQDALVKQLKFVLVRGRWLIEEEKVLGPLSKIRK